MGKDHTMEFIYMTRWRLRGENVNAVLLLISGVWGYLLYALTAWYKISSVSLQNDLSLKMSFACFLDFLCEKESSEWKPGSKCIAQILKLKVERYTKFARKVCSEF